MARSAPVNRPAVSQKRPQQDVRYLEDLEAVGNETSAARLPQAGLRKQGVKLKPVSSLRASRSSCLSCSSGLQLTMFVSCGLLRSDSRHVPLTLAFRSLQCCSVDLLRFGTQPCLALGDTFGRELSFRSPVATICRCTAPMRTSSSQRQPGLARLCVPVCRAQLTCIYCCLRLT